MASVLFLVGLGREEPSVVRDLLDLEKTPRKPQFEMAPEEPLLLWNSGFEPGTVEWQLSRGASEQLVQHVAQSTQRHLVRAGIWAESWAHLRRRAAGLPGIGETRSNARGDTSDHPMEPEDACEGRSMGVPAEVISAVTALAPSGRVGSGGTRARSTSSWRIARRNRRTRNGENNSGNEGVGRCARQIATGRRWSPSCRRARERDARGFSSRVECVEFSTFCT